MSHADTIARDDNRMVPLFQGPPPLSLYIHLPWCVKKCPYCDFNSYAATGFDERGYCDALVRDLEFEASHIGERPLHSVFIGGGTPSLFSADALDTVLAAARGCFNILSDIEITLEANPGAMEAARFARYRQIGVNRLSIGVQSFQDNHLRTLGRVHDGRQARQAIHIARQAGFDVINLDLMFGLPGQSVAEALDDLRVAAAYGPAHLSWYQLTIEPNTVFYAEPPNLPEDDVLWDMQAAGQAWLADTDYIQYEISAYARDGKQCRHNLNYWRFGDYLGIGAGAHGKITNIAAAHVRRYQRHRLPGRYRTLAGDHRVITRTYKLDEHDLSLEFMMNTMRLVEGVPAALFSRQTGLPLAVIWEKLYQARQRQLLEIKDDVIRPTPKGLRYLNELLQLFL